MALTKEHKYLNDDHSRFAANDYRESDSKDWDESHFHFHEKEFGKNLDEDDEFTTYGKNYYGKGPKGYMRSDETIKEDVSEILWRHPEVDASGVEVRVESGWVELKGIVKSRFEKKMIERLIENVAGVEDVLNMLTLDRSIKVEGPIKGLN